MTIMGNWWLANGQWMEIERLWNKISVTFVRRDIRLENLAGYLLRTKTKQRNRISGKSERAYDKWILWSDFPFYCILMWVSENGSLCESKLLSWATLCFSGYVLHICKLMVRICLLLKYLRNKDRTANPNIFRYKPYSLLYSKISAHW